MIELEKKWLLKKPLTNELLNHGFKLLSSDLLIQVYLNANQRLRWTVGMHGNPDKFEKMTKVHLENGMSEEGGIEYITQEEYEELLKSKVCWLRKYRTSYLGPDGYKYEHDEIHIPKGLVIHVLEVEFQDVYKTMEEVDKFYSLPKIIKDRVIDDVTGNSNFSNYNLSL